MEYFNDNKTIVKVNHLGFSYIDNMHIRFITVPKESKSFCIYFPMIDFFSDMTYWYKYGFTLCTNSIFRTLCLHWSQWTSTGSKSSTGGAVVQRTIVHMLPVLLQHARPAYRYPECVQEDIWRTGESDLEPLRGPGDGLAVWTSVYTRRNSIQCRLR
jgi:hypothetical protein